MRYLELNGAYAINPEWNLTVARAAHRIGELESCFTLYRPRQPAFYAEHDRFRRHHVRRASLVYGVRQQSGSQFLDRHRHEGADRRQQCARSVSERARSWTSVIGWWTSLFNSVMEAGDSIYRRKASSSIGNWSVFGSGVYMFNPRTQNDTFSPRSMLAPGGTAGD